MSCQAEVIADLRSERAERERENGGAHPLAETLAAGSGNEVGRRVDGAQREEVVALELLDADQLTVVMHDEVQPPRLRPPGAVVLPIALVHDDAATDARVRDVVRRRRRVLLEVVGQLVGQLRQVRLVIGRSSRSAVRSRRSNSGQ